MPGTRIFWALLLLTASAGSAFADDALTGVLRRVAVTEREIIVAQPGEGGKEAYATVAVTADTIITRDGKPVELQDLKPEQVVTVRTEKRDGRLTALLIRVGAAPELAPPAAAEAPPAPPGTKIAKVRRVLKLVDRILERVENRINPPPPPAPPPEPKP
jgi:hypothetical protein